MENIVLLSLWCGRTDQVQGDAGQGHVEDPHHPGDHWHQVWRG